jgi:hypothetical protein
MLHRRSQITVKLRVMTPAERESKNKKFERTAASAATAAAAGGKVVRAHY